jgi:hypothetical protein
MKDYVERLLHPGRLYTASDIAGRPCPVPARPGVYAWYFTDPPPHVHSTACHQFAGRLLLYVGISPKAPPMNGRAPSRSTLRKRIQTHYFGNAEGSTLRRTLGCLLSSQVGIQLRRVGSGSRYTFTNPGERLLDGWMSRCALVTWVAIEQPWTLEKHLLSSGLILPLNVDGNLSLEAVAVARGVRLKAKQIADELEIVADNGGPRRVKTIITA